MVIELNDIDESAILTTVDNFLICMGEDIGSTICDKVMSLRNIIKWIRVDISKQMVNLNSGYLTEEEQKESLEKIEADKMIEQEIILYIEALLNLKESHIPNKEKTSFWPFRRK